MIAARQSGKSTATTQTIQRLVEHLNSRPVSNMLLSEGTVYGSRYCCAEPVGGNWLEMEQWCTETFGAPNHSIWAEKHAPQPAQRWYGNNRKFWFRTEKDRDWFIIRWSS